MRRITPDNISILGTNEIFVFGSNESGIHGAGAAKYALENFGARWGLGFGRSNQSFAIPTKNWGIKFLSIEYIKFYVDRFIEYTKLKPTFNFYVTEIGCGLAGWHYEDIAPLFYEARNLTNLYFPECFWEYFEEKETGILNQ